MHNFLLPKFIGSDMLFVDQDTVSLNFIKTAELNNIKVVGMGVNVKVATEWMASVAKIPYFVTHLR
ncbi:hypothetical protein GCK32_020612 [Trichostrongylus colubriformis]|uniref:Uncharacterized protein n=1 Tax=Trichostrongylus colubriformis TaxID=6319 RepID=A0AAN8GBA8_TRICO